MAKRWLRKSVWVLCVVAVMAAAIMAVPAEVRAQAAQCLCVPHDPVIKNMKKKFHGLRDFLMDDYFKNTVLSTLQQTADVLSVAGMQQVYTVGTFFDAKQQLETLREFERLKFEAHKDYQPDEGFCAIGTNARSLAASDMRSRLNERALNKYFMNRLSGKIGTSGGEEPLSDLKSRWMQFTQTYCDPHSNNWGGEGEAVKGMSQMCRGGGDAKRLARDVDFTRFFEGARTLDINFTDETPSADEQDILALGNNLYAHNLPDRNMEFLNQSGQGHQYLSVRSVMARRAVARHSFDALVAMKSAGSSGPQEEAAQTYRYLGAALRDLGMSNDDIIEIIGENPSYFAQLEVLSKKLYQSPNFIAALYDSPANISRKKAALNAIELLLERAIHESELRQEMVLSVLLASDLNENFTAARARTGATK